MTLSRIGVKAPSKCRAAIYSRCAAGLLCAASACCAQAAQAPGMLLSSHVRVVAKAAPETQTPSATARKPLDNALGKKTASPPSPSDTAARPATVSLKNGELTVKADNSDLTRILQDVADISGMAISGLDKNARVFGVYGPGNPRDVLTDLLAGSGYNFMMIGDTTGGAPRELLLTAQSNNAPALSPAKPPPAASDDDDSDASDPAPPVDPQGIQDGRMQQTLQRLQQLHQQQQQQNPPQ